MNRRTAIIRTAISALSASVFSAAGWLMGTRSLTMTGWQWSTLADCPGGPSDCACLHSAGTWCNLDNQCAFEVRCRAVDYEYYACCSTYPNTICKLGQLRHGCGSCSGC